MAAQDGGAADGAWAADGLEAELSKEEIELFRTRREEEGAEGQGDEPVRVRLLSEGQATARDASRREAGSVRGMPPQMAGGSSSREHSRKKSKRGSIMGISLQSFQTLERGMTNKTLDISEADEVEAAAEEEKAAAENALARDGLPDNAKGRPAQSEVVQQESQALVASDAKPLPISLPQRKSSTGSTRRTSFSRLNTSGLPHPGSTPLAHGITAPELLAAAGRRGKRSSVATLPSAGDSATSNLRVRSHSIVNVSAQRGMAGARRGLVDELRDLYAPVAEEDEGAGEEEVADNMNSPKMLMMRDSIRFSSRMRSLLTMMWLAADADGSGKLDKDEYMELNRKLQVAVIGKYDPKAGRKMAESDWEIDAQGLDHLNFMRFSQSWFQIVDLWTEEVDESAYCDFLMQLTQRMLQRAPDGTLRFREDNKILSLRTYQRHVALDRWEPVPVPPTPSEVRKMYTRPPVEKKKPKRKRVSSAPKARPRPRSLSQPDKSPRPYLKPMPVGRMTLFGGESRKAEVGSTTQVSSLGCLRVGDASQAGRPLGGSRTRGGQAKGQLGSIRHGNVLGAGGTSRLWGQSLEKSVSTGALHRSAMDLGLGGAIVGAKALETAVVVRKPVRNKPYLVESRSQQELLALPEKRPAPGPCGADSAPKFAVLGSPKGPRVSSSFSTSNVLLVKAHQ